MQPEVKLLLGLFLVQGRDEEGLGQGSDSEAVSKRQMPSEAEPLQGRKLLPL